MFEIMLKLYICYICFDLRISIPKINFYFDADDIMGQHGADKDEQIIQINLAYSIEEIMTTVRHELRHCWQVENFGLDSVYYWQNFVYNWRPTEADAELYANKVICGHEIEDSPLYCLSSCIDQKPYEVQNQVYLVLRQYGWRGIVGNHR